MVLRARSLDGRKDARCKPTAAVYFLPLFAQYFDIGLSALFHHALAFVKSRLDVEQEMCRMKNLVFEQQIDLAGVHESMR